MADKKITCEQKIKIAREDERATLVSYIKQMQEMHKENKSTVTTLDFLIDLIKNRE